jgi:hypothetical protein
MADDIPTFPVTAWEVRSVPSYDLVIVKFAFLVHSLQRMEEANPGRNYALTRTQLRELIPVLQSALQRLESSGSPPPPSPRQ